MTIISVEAKIGCDGCGKHFTVDVDPADEVTDGGSVFDAVEDSVRGGCHPLVCSVQGGLMLCPDCTRVVDAFVTEDRSATKEEVEEALEPSNEEEEE